MDGKETLSLPTQFCLSFQVVRIFVHFFLLFHRSFCRYCYFSIFLFLRLWEQSVAQILIISRKKILNNFNSHTFVVYQSSLPLVRRLDKFLRLGFRYFITEGCEDIHEVSSVNATVIIFVKYPDTRVSSFVT